MAEPQTLIEELLERMAALEAEIQRLKAENAELRRRLGLNSQNIFYYKLPLNKRVKNNTDQYNQ